MKQYSRQDIEDLRRRPLREIFALALEAKLAYRGLTFSFCGIINAKSGRCREDGRFCAPFRHHRTESPVYPLKGSAEIVAAARVAMRRDFLGAAFLAGVDGMMIGSYLTQRGRPPAEDRRFAAEARTLWTS